jgi:hypothetical protein
MIYRTRSEHANHYTTDVVQTYFEGIHNLYFSPSFTSGFFFELIVTSDSFPADFQL